MEIAKGLQIQLYQRMLLARRFEDAHIELLKQGAAPLPSHFSTGQEAASIGVTAALRRDDWLHGTHRGVVDYIGKGMTPRELWAEYYGKTTGCCKGRGGLVLSNMDLGVVPMPGALGTNFGTAVGNAYGFKLQGQDRVAMIIFGEGTSNQVDCAASLNLAALWKAPVVYACINNQYDEMRHYRDSTATEHIAPRAEGYGIAWKIVEDGNDVEAVHEAAVEAVEHARSGAGPYFIEVKTYRLGAHYSGDPDRYRAREEVERWWKKDPLPRYLATLIQRGTLTPEQADEMDRQIRIEVEQAIEFAKQSPLPTVDDVERYVFA